VRAERFDKNGKVDVLFGSNRDHRYFEIVTEEVTATLYWYIPRLCILFYCYRVKAAIIVIGRGYRCIGNYILALMAFYCAERFYYNIIITIYGVLI